MINTTFSTPDTRESCALKLGVSVATVDRLIKARELQAIRIGKSVRIMPDEIQRYLNAKAAA